MSSRLLLPLVLALMAAKLALDHLTDSDLFWHLRLGLDMLDRGRLPDTVEYAWSLPGHAYVANDWLAQVVLALVHRQGGWIGLGIAKAVLVAAATAVLYAAAVARAGGHRPAAAAACALGIAVAASNFLTRPILFGLLCLALTLLACERIVGRASRGWALALPAVFAVWLSVHGSWPVGLAVVGALSASAALPWRVGRWGSRASSGRARTLSLLALPLAAVGLLANPVGPQLWLRPFRLFGERALIGVFAEWAPVPWTEPGAWLLLGSIVLLAVGIALRTKGTAQVTEEADAGNVSAARNGDGLVLVDFALAAALAGLALTTAVYHLFWAAVATPLLAEQLARGLPRNLWRRRSLNAVVAGVAALAVVTIGGARLAGWRQDVEARAPVAVVEALVAAAAPEDRVFNFFDWGGYLVLRGVPTYVDGRLEPFLESGVFARYLAIEREGDLAGVDHLRAKWLLARSGTRLAAAASGDGRWRLVQRDAFAELWEREPEPVETR